MSALDYELELLLSRYRDAREEKRDEVCGRLRRVGIDPNNVPRTGVHASGYETFVRPITVQPWAKNKVAVKWNGWRIPAQTRMGILAAAKAYDRAEGDR